MSDQVVSPSISSIRVCLVEDNENYRSAIATVLNQIEGFSCIDTFTSCEETIDALKDGLTVDVILLDIGLPGMSGLEGIQRFKAISPSTQIIVLTVFDDHDKIFRAICAGASGYLLKASSEQKIADSIREVRTGGAAMTPKVARSVLQMFSTQNQPQQDYDLTRREQDILEWMVKGLTKKEIASKLSLSFHTVDTHLRNIYSKLHVQTRAGAVAKALKEKLF